MTRGIRPGNLETVWKSIHRMKSSILVGLLSIQLGLQTNDAYSANKTSLNKSKVEKSAPTKDEGRAFLKSTSKEGQVISSEDQEKADALRQKTIHQINVLLSSKKKSKQDFELLLRMGELHLEGADYLRDRELEEYTVKYANWEKASESSRGAEPKLEYKESDQRVHQAIQSFRKIVSSYPKHSRTDAALFALGSALSRIGDENAVIYFDQLIKQHAKSRLIPDAWLALGEYYFDKHQIPEATKAYQQIMGFKEHRSYPYAVYKLGWCHYNSQGLNEKTEGENLRKAVAAFKLVVKLADKNASKGGYNIREEALKDLVMAFADTEDTEAAWQYFKSINEEVRFYAMLERLGNLYSEAGKRDKAIEVFTRLVTENTTWKSNPKTYQKLAELYESGNLPAQLVSTIRTMHKLYVSDSDWIKANKGTKELVDEASSVTERTTHRFSTLLHQRGQKTKTPQLEEFAAQIYEIYLTSFANHNNAYDVRYYLADIRLEQERFEEASKHFMIVAKAKPVDGKHLKQSALEAVSAMAELNSRTQFAKLPAKGQVAKPIDLPRVKSLYVAVIDDFTKLLPNEKDGLAMRFTAAETLFDYGHYEKALGRFDKLVTESPDTKQGRASVKLVVGYFMEKGQWPMAIQYGEKYRKNPKLTADEETKKYLESSMKTSMFQNAQALEKSNEFKSSAESFVSFSKTFPNDSNADRALYNASGNFIKAGLIEDAISSQKLLLSSYPKSELAPNVMASLGETLQSLAMFKEASQVYETFSRQFSKDSRSAPAMYNAAVLARGLGDKDRAAKLFLETAKVHPKSDIALSAALEAAKTSESLGDKASALMAHRERLALPTKKSQEDELLSRAKVVELSMAVNPKDSNARTDLQKIEEILVKNQTIKAVEARQVVAKMLFQSQESQHRVFIESRVVGQESIEKEIQQLQAKLEGLSAVYQRVMAIGNAEYYVASLFRMGELSEAFSKILFEAPVPKQMSTAKATAFKSQLEKAAFPLKTEAYKFFEEAFKKSKEVESFSQWTSKTYKKMSDLEPDKNPEINAQVASAGYMSYTVDINPETKSLAK